MRVNIFIGSLWFVLVVMILIYFNSCQVITPMILKLSGNYKEPRYETKNSIEFAIKKDEVYYDKLYRLKEIQFLKELEDKQISKLPILQIYNKEKKLLKTVSGSECNWKLVDYFNRKDSTLLTASDTDLYEFMMQRVEPIDLKSTIDTFDYYIIAGWANYIPKLSKALFEQTNDIKDSLKNQVCIAYINLDFRKD